MIDKFIYDWELKQENDLALQYGGYIYVPYIMAHAETVLEAGRAAMNIILNDSRWVTVTVGNADGITVSDVNR